MGIEASTKWLLGKLPTSWVPVSRRAYPVAIVLLVLSYGAYRVSREALGMRALQTRYATLAQQHAWLRAQRQGRVWLDSLSRPYQGMYWYHLGLLRHAPLPLAVSQKLPVTAVGLAPEYAVCDRQHEAGIPLALVNRPPAYADARLYCWRLPQAARLKSQ